MSTPTEKITGGCQCGAVRYHIAELGRSGVCHCRMCQKATGGIFGVFVTAFGLQWTRSQPKSFTSSNLGHRLFCGDCGTPLAVDEGGRGLEVAVGTLDDPARAAPVLEVHTEGKVAFFATLTSLPQRPAGDAADIAAREAKLVSYQHPDHETAHWPQQGLKL